MAGRSSTRWGPRSAILDDDIFPVDLPAGHVPILVKCGDIGGAGWGFSLRISDEEGRAAGVGTQRSTRESCASHWQNSA